ncbi:Os05g0397600, partial [Oryza sativa Japonica Group]
FLADLIGAAASPRSSISRSYLAPPPRCSAPSSSRGWPAPLPPCRPARRAARRCSGVPSRRPRGTSRRHRHLSVWLLSGAAPAVLHPVELAQLAGAIATLPSSSQNCSALQRRSIPSSSRNQPAPSPPCCPVAQLSSPLQCCLEIRITDV